MLGLWLEDGELSVRDDLPTPRPRRDEALVRVRLAGICGTDLELLKGYYPFVGIPGHEFVGEVVAGPERLVGTRVCGDINVACDRCGRCVAGERRHCARRQVLGLIGRDGAFAEHFVLPTANLEPVPPQVPDEVAVFAEPLAAAMQAAEQIAERDLEDVLVLGDGRLGQLVCRALAVGSRARVVVVGHHSRKLGLLEDLGIETRTEAGVDASFSAVIDCTGSPEGLAQAFAVVRPRGLVVLKSTYATMPAFDVSRIVVNEIQLVGSRCGPIATALEALAHDTVRTDGLVDVTYTLREGLDAFHHAAGRGAMKVLLKAEEGT